MKIFLESGMTIATVGTLFPAIPLAIVALNFRYMSLAGLMRNISSQIEMPEVNQSRQNILNQELIVMRKRMVMVKYSLFPLPPDDYCSTLPPAVIALPVF